MIVVIMNYNYIKKRLILELKSILSIKISGNSLKVQFGSGNNYISGWINTDIPAAYSDYGLLPDSYLDITKKFPLKSSTCKYLYNEHLIEHITVKDADFFLKECYRVLKKNGIIRIATPDLNYLVSKYSSKKWKSQNWLTWPEYEFIETPAEMLNIALRWWGHKYVYDEMELVRRLKKAGFKKMKRYKKGVGSNSVLSNLETREDSKLIIEAIK